MAVYSHGGTFQADWGKYTPSSALFVTKYPSFPVQELCWTVKRPPKEDKLHYGNVWSRQGVLDKSVMNANSQEIRDKATFPNKNWKPHWMGIFRGLRFTNMTVHPTCSQMIFPFFRTEINRLLLTKRSSVLIVLSFSPLYGNFRFANELRDSAQSSLHSLFLFSCFLSSTSFIKMVYLLKLMIFFYYLYYYCVLLV